MKFPRPNTRVRDVFDLLSDGKRHTRKELSNAYAKRPPRINGEYISLTLSRILSQYADRVERGVYVMKKEYLEAISPPPVEVKVGPVVFSPSIDWALKNMGRIGKEMLAAPVVQSGSLLTPVDHGACPIPDLGFQPIRNVPVREPKLSDICGTCGERYGWHYGPYNSSDCPNMDAEGIPSRYPEDKRTKFWSERKIQGSPEIEDMAWKSYGTAGLDALGELKQTIKSLREENARLQKMADDALVLFADENKKVRALQEDTISVEMHLDAMMHKDFEINDLKDRAASLEADVKDRDTVIANQMRVNLELTGQRNSLEWKLKQIREMTDRE